MLDRTEKMAPAMAVEVSGFAGRVLGRFWRERREMGLINGTAGLLVGKTGDAIFGLSMAMMVVAAIC